MSVKIFDGIAIFPLSLDSTSKVVEIVVSKSEPVIVNWLPSNSNKKLSRIGKVLLELITPPIKLTFFNNVLLDTINFI